MGSFLYAVRYWGKEKALHEEAVWEETRLVLASRASNARPYSCCGLIMIWIWLSPDAAD